jgi:hypothetical protein
LIDCCRQVRTNPSIYGLFDELFDEMRRIQVIDTVAGDLWTWAGIPSQNNTEGVGISGVESWDGMVEQDEEEDGS